MSNFLSSEALDAANKLLISVDQLLSVASDKYSAIDEHFLRGLCSRVKSARLGFPFVMEEVPCQRVNRLGSVLLGPVFTSKEHPWPTDDRDEPMAPLCQLDASLFPKQVDGIQGLVQVWLPQSGGEQGVHCQDTRGDSHVHQLEIRDSVRWCRCGDRVVLKR